MVFTKPFHRHHVLQNVLKILILGAKSRINKFSAYQGFRCLNLEVWNLWWKIVIFGRGIKHLGLFFNIGCLSFLPCDFFSGGLLGSWLMPD